jgi:hypothetical protein
MVININRQDTSIATFVNHTVAKGASSITPGAASAIADEVRAADASADPAHVLRDAFAAKLPNKPALVDNIMSAFAAAQADPTRGRGTNVLAVRLPFEGKQIGTDLAGPVYANPSPLQMQERIANLVHRYLSVPTLGANLGDLATQFEKGSARKWDPMTFHKLTPEQARSMVVGAPWNIVAAVAAQAAGIEDPIGLYSKESEDYLQQTFPKMAEFMGGTWRHEERRHMGVFKAVSERLTGDRLTVNPNPVDGYHPAPGSDPAELAYSHALGRTATEWAATSMYMWLMAHTTGDLQQAISQPLQDEINHFAKFTGYTKWAYGTDFLDRAVGATRKLTGMVSKQDDRKQDGALGLPALIYAPEAVSVFARVINQLREFDKTLTPELLTGLFGTSPIAKKD